MEFYTLVVVMGEDVAKHTKKEEEAPLLTMHSPLVNGIQTQDQNIQKLVE